MNGIVRYCFAASLLAAFFIACEQPTTAPDASNLEPPGHPSLSIAPNEPSGYTTITDWPFNKDTGSGWRWCTSPVTTNCHPPSTAPGVVISDTSTPGSKPKVLRYSGPGWLRYELPQRQEVHSAFWWKGGTATPLATFIDMPAEAALIQLEVNQTHTGSPIISMYLSRVGAEVAALPNSECTYDQVMASYACRLYGNVNGGNRSVTLSSWHRFEMQLKSGGEGAGVLRWWMDGEMIGDYRLEIRQSALLRYVLGNKGRFDDARISAPSPRPVGGVNTLHARTLGSHTVQLSFVHVDDGTGRPARYSVRYAPTPINWGAATPAYDGNCDENIPGAPGDAAYCNVEGLQDGTSYDFQLVTYRVEANGQVTYGPLSNVASATTTPDDRPGPVHITGRAVWSNAEYFSFVETDDGYGNPANYQVRYAPHPMQWGSATPVTAGPSAAGSAVLSCANFQGRSPGSETMCYIVGLAPNIRYDVQVVAYRGFLDQGATFGPLSNINTFDTRGTASEISYINDLQAQPPQGPDPRHQVLLAFTPAAGADDQPLRYDVRYSVAPLNWGTAASVTEGTCTDVSSWPAGSTNPRQVFCWVHGLQPGTNYQFELIPFRGTLNRDAVFGPKSNVTQATTPN